MTDAYAPTEPGSDALVEMLRRRLQVAIEAELAKVPVYLYTYYASTKSLGDQIGVDDDTADYSPVGLFAARVGTKLLSVVTEKLIQVSLLGRILHSAGGSINFFRRTPPVFPVRILGIGRRELVELDLRGVGYEQLRRFAEVELAAGGEDGHYAQIRRILGSSHFRDIHFRLAQPVPENVDTLAASLHGPFLDAPETSTKLTELPRIETKTEAQETLELVSARGQNPLSSRSHYQMFLALLSELEGYEDDGVLRPWPHRPAPAGRVHGPSALAKVTSKFPINPRARTYPREYWPLVDLCGALFQYTLLIAEANLLVSGAGGRCFFNPELVSVICSMIDELNEVLRVQHEPDGTCLAPTFEFIKRGSRREAYANLCKLAERVGEQHPELSATIARIQGTDSMTRLPDVSACF